MNAQFICARTGEACPRSELCEVANTPLVGAVRRITQEVTGGPGRRASYAAAVLVAELGRVGETMVADFAPTADTSDATVCPGEVIDRGLRGMGPERIAQGVGFLAAKAVEDVIGDLNLRHARAR